MRQTKAQGGVWKRGIQNNLERGKKKDAVALDPVSRKIREGLPPRARRKTGGGWW